MGIFKGLIIIRGELTRLATVLLLIVTVMASNFFIGYNYQNIEKYGNISLGEGIHSSNLLPFPKISSGQDHSLALSEDGEIYVWGRNYNGQLGLGDDDESLVRNYSPQKLTDYNTYLDEVRFIDIAAGDNFSVAIDEDGQIYSWGDNSKGQLGLGDDETQPSQEPTRNYSPQLLSDFDITLRDLAFARISAGESFAFALTQGGELYSWGYNNAGQLGLGDAENTPSGNETRNYSPQRLVNFTSTLAGLNFVDVDLGNTFGLALSEDGKIYSWGDNYFGQLGRGHRDLVAENYIPQDLSMLISSLATIAFSDVSAGENYSLALTTDGKVYSWGRNDYGQLGKGNNLDLANDNELPICIQDSIISLVAMRFSSISAGEGHSLFARDDGTVYSCGNNYNGELGLGTNDASDANNQTLRSLADLVPSFAGVLATDVIAGGTHSDIIAQNGDIYSFGNNEYGQLGLGDNDNMTARNFSPNQIGNLLKPSVSLFYHRDGVTGAALGDNMHADATHISIHCDKVMITTPAISGGAVVSLTLGEPGESNDNLLENSDYTGLSTSQVRLQSDSHAYTQAVSSQWSADAKGLVVEIPAMALAPATKYTINVNGLKKADVFSGKTSYTLTFTTATQGSGQPPHVDPVGPNNPPHVDPVDPSNPPHIDPANPNHPPHINPVSPNKPALSPVLAPVAETNLGDSTVSTGEAHNLLLLISATLLLMLSVTLLQLIRKRIVNS